jgi:hypothetical protein
MKPRPKKPHIPFEARLEQEASRLKQVASQLPPGTERDMLLRKSQQITIAAHINDWLTSPELQPPVSSMAQYRAYILDSDGHVRKAIELVYTKDVEAIEAAKQLVDGHDVELWARDRRIAILKSQDSP